MIFARKQTKIDKTVFVGVSGGVDSSVSVKRLIDQGYKVVGAFMKTWYPDWLDCDWKAERRDAMRVCARLEIPFVEYDLGERYFDDVGMYLVNEYKSGRTPNPDVMCNRHVKFDAFWQSAKADGADQIATGHYARKGQPEEILMGIDQNKDQTYFLWGIDPSVVPQVLFPVGNSEKNIIRQEADRADLITANKPDSQGICFLGQVDLAEFLSHYLDLEPGLVKDTSGQTIGRHDSAYIYTVGQRHGFALDNKETDSDPRFVIEKNVETNEIIVGTKNELESYTERKSVKLIQTNQFDEFSEGKSVSVRYRYRQDLIKAKIKDIKDLTIEFDDMQHSVAPGQSLVIYEGQKMLGGGIIA